MPYAAEVDERTGIKNLQKTGFSVHRELLSICLSVFPRRAVSSMAKDEGGGE